MVNKNYNKQVSPKGYKMGGTIKKMGYESGGKVKKKKDGLVKEVVDHVKKIAKNPREELAFDKTPRANKVSIGTSPLTIARRILANRAKKDKKDK